MESYERKSDIFLNGSSFNTPNKLPPRPYHPHIDSDEEQDEEACLEEEKGKNNSAGQSNLHHSTHKHQNGQSHSPYSDSKHHTASAHKPHPPHSSHSNSHGQGYSHSHSQRSQHSTAGLLMLVDGVGLAIITTATLLEGFDLWEEIFDTYWGSNQIPSVLWLIGRSSQLLGLLFLIGHASSFQMFPNIERFGMCMLTLGPLLNITAYSLFRPHDLHLTWQDNRAWLTSETLEILGISILDISLIDMEEINVLLAEVIGFLVLCCAAGFQFHYHRANTIPGMSFRLDMIHSSECFGLILLIVVAYGQYRMKISKHDMESQKEII